ncbi:MAG: DDE-type integrase/transposase/recombinase [Verrucomicrobia bacterium]|nr:DDE-type integrase/transposase/recombinase [Verrucomicrobiota bacterium]
MATALTRQRSRSSKATGFWRRTAGIGSAVTANNLVEQDHRAIKRRVKASQHFRSFWGAWRTLAGYEAVAVIRKGQAFGRSSEVEAVPLHAFIASRFGVQA